MNEDQADNASAAKPFSAEFSEAWETVDKMINGFFSLLPKLAIAAIAFVVFLALAWMVKRIVLRAAKSHPSEHIGRVMARLSQWVMIIIGLLVSVAIVAPSITPAELLGALGVGSVAIGFAFKDVLQNFLAGILILLRQPFQVGDAVEFGEHMGYVEAIDTRLTVIKTYDGQQVLVPNGEIYTNPIVVKTAYDKRRSQYDVGVGYGDDIGAACEAMLNAMKSTEGVASEPAPDVIVNELAGSSVNIRARWWTDSDSTMGTRSRVIKAIKEALDDAEIDMPYPTQVHLFHDQTEETDGKRTEQREGWPVGDNPPRSRAEAWREENRRERETADASGGNDNRNDNGNGNGNGNGDDQDSGNGYHRPR